MCLDIIFITKHAWVISAEDKLILFFLFNPENSIWHFMQGDNLHEMSILFYDKKLEGKIKMLSAEVTSVKSED